MAEAAAMAEPPLASTAAMAEAPATFPAKAEAPAPFPAKAEEAALLAASAPLAAMAERAAAAEVVKDRCFFTSLPPWQLPWALLSFFLLASLTLDLVLKNENISFTNKNEPSMFRQIMYK